MNRTSNVIIGSIIGTAILMYIFVQAFKVENRSTGYQYREEYREQGRAQVRLEALKAGVGVLDNGVFIWRTNINTSADINIPAASINEIEEIVKDVLIELDKRKGNHEEIVQEKEK